MKTFTVKVEKGVEIVIVDRSHDDIVLRRFTEKDAIFYTSELDSIQENHIEYFWFLISVEDTQVILVNGKKWGRFNDAYRDKDFCKLFYLEDTANLYFEMKDVDSLPDCYEKALKTSLEELFEYPIFATYSMSLCSRSVFEKYSDVLRCMGKTVNEFVEQEKLDRFITVMIELWQLQEAKQFFDKDEIVFSKEVKKKLSSKFVELSKLRIWAFYCAERYKEVHNWKGKWIYKGLYNDKEVTIEVENLHLYLLMPYRNETIGICLGWFEY